MIPLAVLEAVIDASGVTPRIEAALPVGVRARQLTARTLLAGMCLAQADHRPAHLTRVHQALTALSGKDQRRPGVTTEWKHGPHLLTYRQAERTFGLITGALARDEPGGLPSDRLQRTCDGLLEASVPEEFKDASSSLAVDWTDMETFSRPPPAKAGECADPEASRGHRKNNLLRRQDELFYGYYLSAGIMMPGENGPPVPELARRATLPSCRHNPVRALVPVLTAMPAAGIPPGGILAGSGYAHRDADAWALPLSAPGRSSPRTCTRTTADPKSTAAARSSATGTCTAPLHPARCRNSGRWPAAPAGNRSPPTTRRPPSSPGTSSADSPATTPTATTASRAPRPWAKSAAPPAGLDDPGPGPARNPPAPRSRTRRNAAPSRPSPSRLRSPPKPRRNTTTPPPRTAAPTPAAPAPNAASPPPRTPPATTSPAAGAASWA